ncbi:MAG: ATP-binding protein [Candidatus Bathyarchaeota archaeon]|nr:ATP-binding protein [Candidatus Termiticorpusculum sp.]
MVVKTIICVHELFVFMLSDAELKEILIRQRDNLLKKNYGVERDVLKGIKQKLSLPHVVVITGLRRSGKSTLLRQIIKKYYHDENFYYINFEDERLLGFKANEFNRLYEISVGLFGECRTFFLDEVQNVAHFETFIRRFYEEGFKFIVTGSSAELFSREIGTKLTGRRVDITLGTFSFPEFLSLKGVVLTKDFYLRVEVRAEIKKHFEDYLYSGGMPEYLIYGGDQELLNKVYNDLVMKDIVARYRVEDSLSLRELYLFLISNVSNRFSFHSLKKFVDVKSVNTIKKFISYLEQTYFAVVINRFDYSFKRQVLNDKKFYLTDTGFFEILSRTFSKDKGKLLENLVFTNLNREYVDAGASVGGGEIAYFVGYGRECDFVVSSNRQVFGVFQVCYDFNELNRERELEGLLVAMKEFNLKQGFLLTMAQEEEIKVHDSEGCVFVVPVWKWLLEKHHTQITPTNL